MAGHGHLVPHRQVGQDGQVRRKSGVRRVPETRPAGRRQRIVVKALAAGTENFAAQRMNRGIRQALAGKNIATV